MTFGENIKRIRKDMNITQEEMAKRIGISRSYIADIERNRKNISLAVIMKFSKGLNISINEFINDDIKI
ncbi:helix-turn-helix domain-containing protein [Staphylococcus ureilyticus]|uniref:helix-turn-helix domain-containing protein n=1 Tax=Staphylococcus ureilyticus TaxID=94138 RepID=UPI002904E74F|nr:helix-turn-helix transcriptional regulator [Staphylococcus ureilyticus]MDU0461940.1 helix-turn-helix transcriptional regulator [Staphylococcus ureilyticus]